MISDCTNSSAISVDWQYDAGESAEAAGIAGSGSDHQPIGWQSSAMSLVQKAGGCNMIGAGAVLLFLMILSLFGYVLKRKQGGGGKYTRLASDGHKNANSV